MLSGPGKIANAFVRVDQIQAFPVCAWIGLAIVDIHVTIGARVAIDTDAVVGGLVTATIPAVLTRIGQTPVDFALASKAGEAQRTVASESGIDFSLITKSFPIMV